MARLEVPIVACVIGEGGSGGAIAIALADRVLMQENAIYSVISPEGCARDPLARRRRAREGGRRVQAGRRPLPRARRDRRDRPGARGRGAERLERGRAAAEDVARSRRSTTSTGYPAPSSCAGAARSSGRWAFSPSNAGFAGIFHSLHRLFPADRDTACSTAFFDQVETRPVNRAGIGSTEAAREYRPQARSGTNSGAVHRQERRGKAADLRRPAPRRAAAALRLPPRARRRARELGGAEGRAARAGQRALAVHVEDHPLDYATFEGEIPQGQYGAGTVEIWDHGTYELVEEKKDGGLTVRLHGERLEGALDARPRASSTATRRTGCSCASATRPDRRAGEGRRPLRADARHARRRDELPTGDGWLFEVKWDGYRALAYVARRRGHARSAETATT